MAKTTDNNPNGTTIRQGGLYVRTLKSLSIVLTVILLTAGIAMGAEGAEHELPWGNFGIRILNLALFIALLVYFFGKKVTLALKKRSDAIATELSTLERCKIEAQENLAGVEKRIANLDQEREQILQTYRKQGEILKAEILAQAEKSARQMMEQAKATSNNEVQLAIASLRSQMADEITLAAEKIIAEKVSPEEQVELINKSLSKVMFN